MPSLNDIYILFQESCFFVSSPAEPSVDLDFEYIENVFTYLES